MVMKQLFKEHLTKTVDFYLVFQESKCAVFKVNGPYKSNFQVILGGLIGEFRLSTIFLLQLYYCGHL